MTTTTTSTSSTEYSPQGIGHLDEFVPIIDSLGRMWNPLKHPRDRLGRFIRTFSTVKFHMPGSSGTDDNVTGHVLGVDQDGTMTVKVDGIADGTDTDASVGSIVRIPQKLAEVEQIKAQITNKRGERNALNNSNEVEGLQTSAKNLRAIGREDLAKKFDDLIAAHADLQTLPHDAAGDQDFADGMEDLVNRFRALGDEMMHERGKGHAEGTSRQDVRGDLSSEELKRIDTLDNAIATTYVARHSLGNRELDIAREDGRSAAKAPKVRNSAAEGELAKAFIDGGEFWDATSGELVRAQAPQPSGEAVRDTVSNDQTAHMLPALRRAASQKVAQGIARLTGYDRKRQVAVSDRWHVDKNDDKVYPGSVVNVAPTKSREGFKGIVQRIYTDAKGQKHVYARHFDPSNPDYGKKGYQDFPVQAKSIELLPDDQQNALFQQMALNGQNDAVTKLINAFSKDYIEAQRRRYATPGAGRTAPTGGKLDAEGFLDILPTHLRVREDGNGEQMEVGDHVQGPNGENGIVYYFEPNANMSRVLLADGETTRFSPNSLTRLHGPTSEVYLGSNMYGDNHYVPTREEAAATAEKLGATDLATTIRDPNSNAADIQNAMAADPQFQAALPAMDDLNDRIDTEKQAGKTISEADRAALHEWKMLASASAGQFREGEPAAPKIPTAPVAEGTGDPQDPSNATQKVKPDGTSSGGDATTVQTSDETQVQDPEQVAKADQQDQITDPTTEHIGTPTPETPPETPPAQGPPALADMVHNSVKATAEATKKSLPSEANLQRVSIDRAVQKVTDAHAAQDPQAFVDALRDLRTKVINTNINRNLRETPLGQLMRGMKTNNVPMDMFVQNHLNNGNDIFNPPQARVTRPPEVPSTEVIPEGVDPEAHRVDTHMSAALLADDQSSLVLNGDGAVDEGFHVVDPETIQTLQTKPTEAELAQFLSDTADSTLPGVAVWQDETDGQYRMGRVGIFDNEADAATMASQNGSNQYVNIADGLPYNVSVDTPLDDTGKPNSVPDPSAETGVGHVKTDRIAPRTTSKQKKVIGKVKEIVADDPNSPAVAETIGRIERGREIHRAEAEHLAGTIGAINVDRFDKPGDKGVAQQMANRFAEQTGGKPQVGYTSNATAVRRSSDVGNMVRAFAGGDSEITQLLDEGYAAAKDGDYTTAREKYAEALVRHEAQPGANAKAIRQTQAHIARLADTGAAPAPAPPSRPDDVVPEAPTPTPEAPSEPTPEPGSAPTLDETQAPSGVDQPVPEQPVATPPPADPQAEAQVPAEPAADAPSYPELEAAAQAVDKLPDEDYEPTLQQKRIIAAIQTGKNVVVRALAGTGKTSTLQAAAKRMTGKGILYIAFNKSVQLEAAERMPDNVEARTANSLAWKASGKDFTDKTEKGISGVTAQHAYLGRPAIADDRGGTASATQTMAAIKNTLHSYMISDADKLSIDHVPEDHPDADRATILDAAQKAWDDYVDPKGQLRYDQDALVKMWALSRPDFHAGTSGIQTPLPGDGVIFFDEAQDINDVLRKVIQDNTAQVITVGDSNQAIYGFRGATDQMDAVAADYDLPLTKSWRFGPQVAEEGNRGLQLLGSDMRVIGGGPDSEVVAPNSMTDPDAVLTRTNRGAIEAALTFMESGKSVGVSARTKSEILKIADTVAWLRDGGPKPKDWLIHPDLAKYHSWDQVTEAASADRNPDRKAKMIINLTDQYSPEQLKDIASRVKITVSDAGDRPTTPLPEQISSAASGEDNPIDMGDGLFAYLSPDGRQLLFGGNTMANKELIKQGTYNGKRVRWDGANKRWVVDLGGSVDGNDTLARKVTDDLAALQDRIIPHIDVTISTAHLAKGLEWDNVRIWGDFWGAKPNPADPENPIMPEPEEIRLAYVALTRAKKQLDPGSLSWLNSYTKDAADDPLQNGEGAPSTPTPEAPTGEPGVSGPTSEPSAPSVWFDTTAPDLEANAPDLDRLSSWVGDPAVRAWDDVQSALENLDESNPDFAELRGALERYMDSLNAEVDPEHQKWVDAEEAKARRWLDSIPTDQGPSGPGPEQPPGAEEAPAGGPLLPGLGPLSAATTPLPSATW